MNLLYFARGPALEWSLIIMVVGLFWRLLGVLLLTRAADFSAPRDVFATVKGTRTVFSRSWPHPEFLTSTRYQVIMAYIFHLGLLFVVVAFIPHIEFIQGLVGLSWPGLPNSIVLAIAVLTLIALLAMLIRRLTDKVLLAVSTWNDYFSWLITTAPLVTGLMAYSHLGPRYETMLAIHILSFELLLIWFPFGKLMHGIWFIFSRAQSGIAYYRRGVRI